MTATGPNERRPAIAGHDQEQSLKAVALILDQLMQKHQRKKRGMPRDLVAALVVVTFGLAGVLFTLYGDKWFGSPEQRCHDSCATQNKEGVMALVHPRTMTGSKDGPRECHCR
jgi:hypothetical protein